MKYLMFLFLFLFPAKDNPRKPIQKNSIERLETKLEKLNHDIIDLNLYINENLD